ncbi:RNA polymerase sigma factor [Aquipuribacter nitratireducens]|uniref:RNA polymerase sigma factor n=1 Tax=Aquipuribacter nitratireducens TaxID=650104 RepID=A0ABW0GV48_9MICO
MAGARQREHPAGDAGQDPADDLALARAAALGDRDAFEVVVHHHGPAMLRYARRLLRDPVDAEDAVQEALVAAWRGLERYRGESSLRTWLLGLTSHKAVDLARRRRPEPVDRDTVAERPAEEVVDPATHASAGALAAALQRELLGLPYGQRAAWVLVELEGLSQPEVAQVLGVTPDAVRGNLFRARRALEERMARWRP